MPGPSWIVLYTKNNGKKTKIWHDGVLSVDLTIGKYTLMNEKRQVLLTQKLPKLKISVDTTVDFGIYLLQIEREEIKESHEACGLLNPSKESAVFPQEKKVKISSEIKEKAPDESIKHHISRMTDAAMDIPILYTHQKNKKSKTWQDGTLRYLLFKQKGLVYDSSETYLDSVIIKDPTVFLTPGSIETERYLVEWHDDNIETPNLDSFSTAKALQTVQQQREATSSASLQSTPDSGHQCTDLKIDKEIPFVNSVSPRNKAVASENDLMCMINDYLTNSK